MRAKPRTREEQYQLILECRSSGLSDYNWCKEHGIKTGTFYNWVKRLRKTGTYDIPPAANRNTYAAAPKQDIVKVEVMDEEPVVQICKPGLDHRPGNSDAASFDPSMELVMAGTNLRISNHADPELLARVLFLIRE